MKTRKTQNTNITRSTLNLNAQTPLDSLLPRAALDAGVDPNCLKPLMCCFGSNLNIRIQSVDINKVNVKSCGGCGGGCNGACGGGVWPMPPKKPIYPIDPNDPSFGGGGDENDEECDCIARENPADKD